jgi:hypothetical protein
MKIQHVATLTVIGMLAVVTDPRPARALSCSSDDECANPRTEDTMVVGCDATEPGSVGIETLLGNDGQTVSVDVSVIAANRIDGFMIDLTYPVGLVQFQSASRGNLILDWAAFDYNPFPGGVRFLGTGGAGFIEDGESGNLATLTFSVIEPGCDVFCILNLWDHIEGYITCGSELVSAPETLVTGTWGQIKSGYK